jgi:transposase
MQKIRKKVRKKVKIKGKTPKVRLMFCDEARFGLIDCKTGCWAPAGVRPEILMKLTRQYIYAYNAVSPSDGGAVSLVLPFANTESMSVFLKEVSTVYPDDYNVIFMDQAGWHKSKDLEIPENIRIEFLPPYSPQLNPVEHVWDELREKYFKNQYFADMEQVVEQLRKGLKYLKDNPEKVASISGFPWIKKAI